MRDAFGQIVGSVRIEPPGPISIPLPGGRGQVVLSTQPTRPLEQAGMFVQQNAGMLGIAAAALVLFMVMGARGRGR
jgi:hypothetical protein